jgi:hypothetical protein
MDHAAHTTDAPVSVNHLAARATTHCLIGRGVNRWLIGRGRGHAAVHGAH